MSVPDPGPDGIRRYGQWAGNERGQREVVGYCIEEVWPANTFIARQCGRLRGHGPDGLYCRQHGKKAEKRASNEVFHPTKEGA